MIVPMKQVTLLAIADEREQNLEHLRELGVLHLSVTPADAPRVRDAQRVRADTELAITLIRRAIKHKHNAQPSSIPKTVADILALDRERAELETTRERLAREAHRYESFGDFDPAAARRLIASGIPVKLFKCQSHKMLHSAEHAFVLGTSGVGVSGVAFSDPLPAGFVSVELPEQNPTVTRAQLVAIERDMAARTAALAAAEPLLPELTAAVAEHKDGAVFAAAWEGTAQHGAIDAIQGFMPAEDLPILQAAAAQNGWGLATRDPAPGDRPPTLLRPPKAFRPILELFQLLNISPAYNETDISVSFYIFFTIFGAMIIGDAGYGAVILLALLAARTKLRDKLPRPVFNLGMVFGIATIIWGVLTGTYFGIAHETLPSVLAHPLAKWFAVNDNMMLFCFIIGAVHLSLARLWNAILLFPNTKFLAQLGWIGVLWGLFCFISSIVISGFTLPGFTLPLLGVSLLFIIFFTIGKGELKTNGFQLAMLPLTLSSTMGDIISYLRLFAIGLAALQVAQNFNNMAIGIDLPVYLKIPVLIIILAFAHALNLVLGGLSVIVHAVRLNTLEFANSKGISWAGSAYRPFKKSTQPTIKETP